MRIYENGAYRGAFGTATPSTVFKIARVGTAVMYYKDNVLVYTHVGAVSTNAMIFDCSLYRNTRAEEVKITY